MHFKEGYVCIELFQISTKAYIMLKHALGRKHWATEKIQGVSRAVKVEY
jgi:hypothetical protein